MTETYKEYPKISLRGNKKKELFSQTLYPIINLKHTRTIIAPILVDLFNNSLRQGICSKELKDAFIIPICKLGDRSLVENYRPINISKCTARLLETIVCEPQARVSVKRNVVDFGSTPEADHSD